MACGARAEAFLPLSLWGEGILNSDCEVIPIAGPEFTKVQINENPLLKVPPVSRGNRTGAPLTVPLAKRGEPKGGGQIENFGRAIGKCLCVGFSTCPPSQPPPWTGEEPRLPPRPRGRLGWGLCSNLTAKTLIIPTAHPEFVRESAITTPSLRFPLRAGGTDWARLSVPLAKWGGYEPAHGLVPLAKRGEP